MLQLVKIENLLEIAHNFYSNLYSHHAVIDANCILDKVNVNSFPVEQMDLTNNLTKDELIKVLKGFGDTASGPDGISYRLIKTCW